MSAKVTAPAHFSISALEFYSAYLFVYVFIMRLLCICYLTDMGRVIRAWNINRTLRVLIRSYLGYSWVVYLANGCVINQCFKMAARSTSVE